MRNLLRVRTTYYSLAHARRILEPKIARGGSMITEPE
jgi:hypothetical protein